MSALPENPSIAIVGAGAVGGYYGARLAQHGRNVHFLLRSDFEFVKKNGWRIKSQDGDFDLPANKIHVYNDPSRMCKVDIVIVTLKTTANDQIGNLVKPLLHEKTAVITLQNGLGNEDLLADLFGAERVIGAMAFTCINRVGPGEIHHMDHGIIRIGEFRGGPSERVTSLSNLFNSSQIRCEVLDDLLTGRWEKLVWNVPFNGLGAVMDLTTDKLINNPDGEKLVLGLMAEVMEIAASLNIEFPRNLAELKVSQTRTMGAYKSSMQIDREFGRPLEVDAIFGQVVRTARRQGVATPLLDVLYGQLRVF